MKTKLIFFSAILFLASGCLNMRDAVPQTQLENHVVMPSRAAVNLAGQKTVAALVEKDVIKNKDDLVEVLSLMEKSHGNWFERLFERKKMHAWLTYDSPKDLQSTNLVVKYSPEDGAITFSADELSAKTNPEIVITTGDGQAKITDAQGDLIQKFMGGFSTNLSALGGILKPGL